MTKKCCICGRIFTGYGNDPWPVNNSEVACCCDDCNIGVVIPARLKMMRDAERKGEKKSIKFLAHGKERECFLDITKYVFNDNLAIGLIETDTHELWGFWTVNTDKSLPQNMAAVDINNMPEAPEIIEKYTLGRKTGNFVKSGYCTYPIYEFDLKKLAEYEWEI